MSENIAPSAQFPSGSDLEGRAQPTDTTVGRSDPMGTTSLQSFIASESKSYFYPILFAIIFLATLGVGIFFFIRAQSLTKQVESLRSTVNPSPSPVISTESISDWQTYVSSLHGFSFKYPKTWDIDLSTGTDSGDILVINSPSDSLLRVYKYEDKSKTISDFLVKRDEGNSTSWEGSPSIKIINTKKTVIAGLNTIQRVESLLAAGFDRIATYFKNEGSFIQLSLDPKNGGDLNQSDIEVYNQILSTFHFLD